MKEWVVLCLLALLVNSENPEIIDVKHRREEPQQFTEYETELLREDVPMVCSSTWLHMPDELVGPGKSELPG